MTELDTCMDGPALDQAQEIKADEQSNGISQHMNLSEGYLAAQKQFHAAYQTFMSNLSKNTQESVEQQPNEDCVDLTTSKETNAKNEDDVLPLESPEDSEPALRETTEAEQHDLFSSANTSRLPTIADISAAPDDVSSTTSTLRLPDYSQTKFQPWSAHEDKLLAEGVALYKGKGAGGTIDWTCVAAHLGNVRSTKQCTSRWQTICMKERRVKIRSEPIFRHKGTNAGAPWTPSEDTRLIDALMIYKHMGLHGGVDWTRVSAAVGNDRSPSACASRWQHITNGANKGATSSPKPLIVIPPKPIDTKTQLVLPPSTLSTTSSSTLTNSSTENILTAEKSPESNIPGIIPPAPVVSGSPSHPLRRLSDTSTAENPKTIPSITTLSSDPVSIPILSSAPLLTATASITPSEEQWEAVAAAIAPIKRARYDDVDLSHQQPQNFSEFKFAANSYSDMQPFKVGPVAPRPPPMQYSRMSQFDQFPLYQPPPNPYASHSPPSMYAPYNHMYSQYDQPPMYSSPSYTSYANMNSFKQWEQQTLSRLRNPYAGITPEYSSYQPPSFPPQPQYINPHKYDSFQDAYWSMEEDRRLMDMVYHYGARIDWNHVSSILRRTPDACYARYLEVTGTSPQQQEYDFAHSHYPSQASVVHESPREWEHAEDELLMDAVARFRSQQHSEISWAAVVSFLNRHGVQRDANACRERWAILVSSPVIDETALVEAVAQCREGFSIDWEVVSAHMKGEWSPDLCASYWYQTAVQRSSGEWADFFQRHPHLESFNPLDIHDAP